MLIPLTKISVDAIVNAANKNLSNGAGVALAIAKEAGKQYQRECDDLVKKNGKIAVSKNVVTKSHKLQKTCKHVINAVGPDWADYTDKEDALKDLALTVENVLETAVTMNMTSVAMPPISSGIFGFPKEACAWMYSKGVLDFTWKGSHGQLKEVILVDVQDSTILDMTFQYLSKISNNGATIQIKDVLKSLPKEQPLRGAEGGTARADKSERKSVKASTNTTDRLCSHTMEKGADIFNFRNSVEVLVYTADIIRLPNVDILVTPESRSFKGEGILARKIAETAGKDYTKERRKLEGQPRQSGEILITIAGNLKFQKIFHVIMSRFDDRGPPNDTQLNQFKTLIKDVIQRANDLNVKKTKLKSIAMPLLGTGHIRDQWLLTAIGGAVFDGIYRYSKSAKTSVKEIHLVNINEETTSAIRKIFLSEATEKGNLAIIDDDDESDNSCVVCMEPMDQPVALRNCGHQFCRDCILDYFSRKPSCPMCNTMYGKLYGDQPVDATANVYLDKSSLPGHEGHGTFIIDYDIPDGRQNDQHPNPGMSYRGFRRRAYLPDTEEGQTVLHLLREAFNQGLIFTIGYSRTTGKDNVLTWNDIHHKTRKEGGPQRFGYPDPEYIPRVKEELAAKGIR
ncbi:hypothetical protein FSP39_011190 [Pinctada imbricata]|uniref:E3 ubiquitin-protein ligase n=1 Tax=Pinctada imbricata TaxID=66713 RepID=A0AA88YQW3_PINIB|nr:hypothetical protein FSP39_011190 [Pinctada imbricata]